MSARTIKYLAEGPQKFFPTVGTENNPVFSLGLERKTLPWFLVGGRTYCCPHCLSFGNLLAVSLRRGGFCLVLQ